jgi:hypothetical protein
MWTTAPRIVAEHLQGVREPLGLSLAPGPPASGVEVARALARSLLPPERPATPPAWLLPGQVRSFRRALAALVRHGGALLADPVGSGKTYVSLAVAAALGAGRPTACLVPATLTDQWRAVAASLGVLVAVETHQAASRGRLPARTRGLVIVDESHHLRNPATRRYRTLAPWLIGRPVLLLSATPVVNRLEDLAHQLLLGVRDDALAADGVVSLKAAIASGCGLEALGSIIIEEPAHVGPRPARNVVLSVPTAEETRRAMRTIAALARLRLSSIPSVKTLVRGVLVGSAASSLPALVSALRRYRALLRHAADAAREGRRLGRAELRRFAGGLDDQMVLWTLVAGAEGATNDGGRLELALDDLRALEIVMVQVEEAAAKNDPKIERLRGLVGDRLPTIVFCTRRETVRHLRDRLAPPAVAWCTGDRAGLGPLPAPRASVLAWFRDTHDFAWQESGVRVPPPSCLIVTDVAAEGLDLRRAGRIVHYDLPWTPMRLEQREGRAVRLGSVRAEVEVIRFGMPQPYEAALALGARLRRKAGMPARVGIGPDGGRLWRWRAELADALHGDSATHGCAQVPARTAMLCPGTNGGGTSLLAGFEILGVRSGHRQPLGSVVGWLDQRGSWCEDSGTVSARLREAAACARVICPAPAAVRAALERLAVPTLSRLAAAAARGWMAAEPEPSVRVLAQRLGELVRLAARGRDATALTRLEAALAFVARGHTAGESMLVQQLVGADERTLRNVLARMPPAPPRWDALDVRLTGLVLFDG